MNRSPIREVKTTDLQHMLATDPDVKVVTVYCIPFRDKVRASDDESLWYRVVFEVQMGNSQVEVVLVTARNEFRKFRSPGKALEFLDSEFKEIEDVRFLRRLDNEYNVRLGAQRPD